jgi:indole-3-glycerol phosphate synthase
MGFLAKIVAATEGAIARPDYLAGLPMTPRTASHSLRTAILEAGPGGALIGEYKRRSPGAPAPELFPPSIEQFVHQTSAGVAAYSCLATTPEFGGAPTDVAALAAQTPRPVLFKDFVVDPIQIEAAARSGASAILLIARLESDGLLRVPLRALARAAHDRGLEVLLEWHERAELRRTEDVPADVYGVNVRDLDTLEMQPSVATETILAAGHFRPLLGLSGVEGPVEAQRFWAAGVDGILVGGALARAPNLRQFLTSLQRPVMEGRA